MLVTVNKLKYMPYYMVVAVYNTNEKEKGKKKNKQTKTWSIAKLFTLHLSLLNLCLFRISLRRYCQKKVVKGGSFQKI